MLVGALYWQVTDAYSPGFQNRTGALYYVLINQTFTSLGSVGAFFEQREIFAHERQGSTYSTAAYFLAKVGNESVPHKDLVPQQLKVAPCFLVKWAAELPPQVFFATLFSAISYWMVGLQANFHKFLVYTAVVVLTTTVAESYAVCVGTAFKDQKAALVVAPVALSLFLLFGGYFVQLGSIPIVLRWLQFASVFKYEFAAIITNELDGLTFTDAPNEMMADGANVLKTLKVRRVCHSDDIYGVARSCVSHAKEERLFLSDKQTNSEQQLESRVSPDRRRARRDAPARSARRARQLRHPARHSPGVPRDRFRQPLPRRAQGLLVQGRVLPTATAGPGGVATLARTTTMTSHRTSLIFVASGLRHGVVGGVAHRHSRGHSAVRSPTTPVITRAHHLPARAPRCSYAWALVCGPLAQPPRCGRGVVCEATKARCREVERDFRRRKPAGALQKDNLEK